MLYSKLYLRYHTVNRYNNVISTVILNISIVPILIKRRHLCCMTESLIKPTCTYNNPNIPEIERKCDEMKAGGSRYKYLK